MEDPTKAQVDAVLDAIQRTRIIKAPSIKLARAESGRLHPLASMTWTEAEKQRLRTYGAQMTRFRVRRGWFFKFWGKLGRT